MTYDPKYKLRHKPPRIERLLRWKYLPPRMVGDPEVMHWHKKRGESAWDFRCRVIYDAMMLEKNGRIPRHIMRGLWMWDLYDAPQRSPDDLPVVSHAAAVSVVDTANL